MYLFHLPSKLVLFISLPGVATSFSTFILGQVVGGDNFCNFAGCFLPRGSSSSDSEDEKTFFLRDLLHTCVGSPISSPSSVLSSLVSSALDALALAIE